MNKQSRPKKFLRFIFLGPQGSGKGTQAEMLSQRFGIPRISPGDIYRREIKKDTKLGRLIASYINKGSLTPDELTNKIIAKRLKKKDCKKGFILDGYPRDMIQAEALEKMTDLDYAVFLNISDAEGVSRIAKRRVCRCGASYHLKYKPSIKKGTCDKCGDKLYQREDDHPKAIRRRLEIYHRQTQPLIDYYRKKGILIKINGEQPIRKVYGNIIKKLGIK